MIRYWSSNHSEPIVSYHHLIGILSHSGDYRGSTCFRKSWESMRQVQSATRLRQDPSRVELPTLTSPPSRPAATTSLSYHKINDIIRYHVATGADNWRKGHLCRPRAQVLQSILSERRPFPSQVLYTLSSRPFVLGRRPCRCRRISRKEEHRMIRR